MTHFNTAPQVATAAEAATPGAPEVVDPNQKPGLLSQAGYLATAGLALIVARRLSMAEEADHCSPPSHWQ